MKALAILIAATLTGCAANPGIVKMSPDTYMVTRTDHGGIFGNSAAMKSDVIREATAFAESQGKVAAPLVMRETPRSPERFGTFEYQFRILEKGDPAAYGVVLEQQLQQQQMPPPPVLVMPPTPIRCSSFTFGSNSQTHCE